MNEIVDQYDIVFFWNYPGYNHYDLGNTSLYKIKESHWNLILNIQDRI